MPYKDPVKQKAAQAASYERHKAAQVERNRQERLKRRSVVNKIKLARGCERCGYNDHPAALDAHHRSDDKEGTLSLMTRSCANIDLILAELSKCEILCANCHRVHHATTNTLGTNKAPSANGQAVTLSR